MLNALELVTAKFQPPRLNPNVIPRTKVIERLHENPDRPLTLICAPAGYGKSTIAAQWLLGLGLDTSPSSTREASASGRGMCLWITIEDTDNDLSVLLGKIAGAIQIAMPDGCAETLSLLNAINEVPTEHLTKVFFQDMAKPTSSRIYLVLDDYHNIRDADVHLFMAKLVHRIPPQLHLVILSRTEPPIALARLRLYGHIADIRMRHLRFDLDEVAAYLTHTHCDTLSPAQVEQLAILCEGWAAGIQSALLSLSDGASPDAVLRDLRGGQRDIMDYLAEEVLANRPGDIMNFLLRTSILARFTPSLCDAMLVVHLDHVDADQPSFLPTRDSAAIIDQLARENLFLIFLDDQRVWHRYHHLLQGVLREQLQVRLGEHAIDQLHHAAFFWFEKQGLLEEAFQHALVIGPTFTAEFVERHAYALLNEQQIPLVHRWIQQIPESIIQDRARLLIVQAWLLNTRGRMAPLPGLLTRVEALLAQQGDKFEPDVIAEIRGGIANFRCLLAFRDNADPREVLRQANFALENFGSLRREYNWMMGHASLFRGAGMVYLGHGQEIIQEYMDILARHIGPPDSYTLRLWQFIAYAHMANLDIQQLAQCTSHLIAAAKASNHELSLGWGYFLHGKALYERNDLVAAEQSFAAAVSLRYRTHSLCISEGLIALSLIRLAQGRIEEAENFRAEAEAQVSAIMGAVPDENLQSLALRIALADNRVDPMSGTLHVPEVRFDSALASRLDIPAITAARWRLAMGAPDELEFLHASVKRIIEGSQKYHLVRQSLPAHAMYALICRAMGRRQESHHALEKALSLAQPRGLVRTFLDFGPTMAELLHSHRARSQYRAYVDSLLEYFAQEPAAKLQQATDGKSQRTPNRNLRRKSAGTAQVDSLTDREIEVYELLAEHNTYQEIATQLVISPKTVKKHVSNIYGKLGVGRRREALQLAHHLQLFD